MVFIKTLIFIAVIYTMGWIAGYYYHKDFVAPNTKKVIK